MAARAASDRFEDCLVLQIRQLAQLHQVGIATLLGIDARARDHRVAQVINHIGEVAVAGGLGNQLMEAHVGFDAAVVVGQRGLVVVEGLAHELQLRLAATQRGQGGGLGFQAEAQLKDATHADGGVVVQLQALALVPLEHKGAHPMPGFHQPRRLQLRQRLTHHRATDAVFANDGRLGGQLFARRHLAEENALGQRSDDVMGKALGALAGGVVVHRSFHGLGPANTNISIHH